MSRSFYGKVGIEITDDLSKGLEFLVPAIQEAALMAVEAGGEIIRESAYAKANVSPGVYGHGAHGEHMRDEIKVTAQMTEQGAVGRVQIDMSIIPYAAHQEFGARGKPFLRPAIDETREQVRETMRNIISHQVMSGFKMSTTVKKRNIA